jgi:hypothetical protein
MAGYCQTMTDSRSAEPQKSASACRLKRPVNQRGQHRRDVARHRGPWSIAQVWLAWPWQAASFLRGSWRSRCFASHARHCRPSRHARLPSWRPHPAPSILALGLRGAEACAARTYKRESPDSRSSSCGYRRKDACWKEDIYPQHHIERNAYLAAIHNAIGSLSEVRIVLSQATHRIEAGKLQEGR